MSRRFLKPNFIRPNSPVSLRSFLVLLGMCTLILMPNSAMSADWFPVRVDLDYEVNGVPHTHESHIRCEKYRVTNLGCFGCARWRASRSVVVTPHPTGGYIMAHFIRACDSKSGAMGDQIELPTLAWVDHFSKPTIIEKYGRSYSDWKNLGAAAQFHNVNVSVHKVPRDPSIDYENELKNETSWVLPRRDHSGKNGGYQFLSFRAVKYPPCFWKGNKWLEQRLEKIKKTTSLVFAKDDYSRFAKIVFSARKRESRKREYCTEGQVYGVQPNGGGTWSLDHSAQGVEFHYRMDILPSGIPNPQSLDKPEEALAGFFKRQSFVFEGEAFPVGTKRKGLWIFHAKSGDLYRIKAAFRFAFYISKNNK